MPASSIRLERIAYPILSRHTDHMCLEGEVTRRMANTCYCEHVDIASYSGTISKWSNTPLADTISMSNRYWYIAIVNADIPSFVLLPCAQPNDGEFTHHARMTEVVP